MFVASWCSLRSRRENRARLVDGPRRFASDSQLDGGQQLVAAQGLARLQNADSPMHIRVSAD
jgi:hypothetical protein